MEAHSELKLVTCLFIDIVGSTDAVVRLGPERMQRLLSDGFAEISSTIRAHGGIVEKYVGDAILGVFGVPVARPDDAERALRAAEACTRWASTWAAAGGLGVRAGLETGDLLVDPRALETQQRMMIGESINLAARLQSFAEAGQVIVGPGCHEAAAGVARFEPLGGLELKGFGTVDAWRFDGFAGSAEDVEFVGRHAELVGLRAVFEAARAGSPGLALIVGPPGQGKSRLAQEAIRRAGSFRVLEARCQPEAGANSPLRQLVEAEAGEASADAILVRMRVLLGDDEATPVASAVSHSAGIAIDPVVFALGRMEARELIARAWARYLTVASIGVPLCLYVEDLHWADPVLLRVLDFMTSQTGGSLLALATARPEFLGGDVAPLMLLGSAGTDPSGRSLQIELGPLDEAAAARLAELAGAGDHLAASVERSEGNPLFLIELARVRPGASRLPVTVQAAIAARLDELDPDHRILLQHVSVAGERFGLHEAAVLANREPGDVVSGLGRIAQLGFVVAVGADYRFQHALVRDVVYGRLPVTERMRLHARYATDGAEPDDVVAQAHHWWEALKPPDAAWVWEDGEHHRQLRARATRTHLEAVRRLAARNDYEEGLAVAERAAQLADAVADRAEAEAVVGAMLHRQARGDDAWAHRATALDLYREAGVTPPAQLFADMLELTAFNWGYFHHLPTETQVISLLDEGERIARETGDAVTLARLLAERASYTGNPAGGEELRGLMDVAEPAPFADAAQRMATVYSWTGRIAESISMFERVFDVLLPAGGHINSPEALAWYARAAYEAGDLPLAGRLVDELEVESANRSIHTRSHALALKAVVAFGRGDWAKLQAAEAALRDLADRNPDVSFCLLSAASVGFACAAEVLQGRALRDDVDAQARRQVSDSELVVAASILLPKVMTADADALDRGLAGYEPSLTLGDRYRVWDVAGTMPAIAATILERWDRLPPLLDDLDRVAAHGGRLAGALAAAIREEQRAAAGGPAPAHAELRGLGYHGISELLRYRRAPVAKVA